MIVFRSHGIMWRKSFHYSLVREGHYTPFIIKNTKTVQLMKAVRLIWGKWFTMDGLNAYMAWMDVQNKRH